MKCGEPPLFENNKRIVDFNVAVCVHRCSHNDNWDYFFSVPLVFESQIKAAWKTGKPLKGGAEPITVPTHNHSSTQTHFHPSPLLMYLMYWSVLESVKKMKKTTPLPMSIYKPAQFPVFIKRRDETFPNQYISTYVQNNSTKATCIHVLSQFSTTGGGFTEAAGPWFLKMLSLL